MGSKHFPDQILISRRKRAEDFFKELDEDDDGEITMDEFCEGYLKLQVKNL